MQVYQNQDTSAPLFPEDVIGESLKRSFVPLGFTEKTLEEVMASAQDGLLNLCTNLLSDFED